VLRPRPMRMFDKLHSQKAIKRGGAINVGDS
jgi:hypothetical protein